MSHPTIKLSAQNEAVREGINLLILNLADIALRVLLKHKNFSEILLNTMKEFLMQIQNQTIIVDNLEGFCSEMVRMNQSLIKDFLVQKFNYLIQHEMYEH